MSSARLAEQPDPPPKWTDASEPGLLQLVNILFKRWRLVAGLPIAAAVLTVAASALIGPTFTATITFVPESPTQQRLPAGIAGLAGQLGIAMAPEGSRSPRFYAELIKGRAMLERVLLSNYADPVGAKSVSDTVSLLTILGSSGRTHVDSVERGVRALQRMIAVTADNQTSIVRVSVDSRYPVLAAAIANRVVEYLNEFNTRHRQSQAGQRRVFVEKRLAEVEDSVRRAEQDLRSFYERNRSWEQAPQLRVEEGRLRRQLDLRQEVHLTLAREYETSRIEEVNDTPVLTVLDPAVTPERRSHPRRAALAAVATAFGLILSVLLAIGVEYFDNLRRDNRSEYLEFRGLVEQMRADFGKFAARVWRRTGSATKTRGSQ
jgi:uncharacterized protein involved in exopolysaccharide biosynthesis